MIRAGMIGLGKMGLSHQAMVNAHPNIELKAVSDPSSYVLEVISKYTGVRGYTNYQDMLSREELDCVFIATPSKYHTDITAAALKQGLHVFCEKPFGLDPAVGFELAELAERKRLVNQVGYHYRFVAAFNEAKRLLERQLLGELHHLRAEAYGPVVLRPRGSTWRSQKDEGGGCLFDYACHAIDLVNYLVGRPRAVSGSVLNSVFSNDVDDEIYSTFHFSQRFQGQLATNWSDDSHRKMSVKLSLWGTKGRLNVDRQEIQVFLRDRPPEEEGFEQGWNVRYTTELTPPVWFYVRGEEYSAQIDHFVRCIEAGTTPVSNFRTASDTGLVAAMMRLDAKKPCTSIELNPPAPGVPIADARPRNRSFLRGLLDRLSSAGQPERG